MKNPELENIIRKLGLKKDDYMFLTIKTVYLYHMKSGEKTVEYREPSDFIFSRLYSDNATKKFSQPKNISHILFQAGYNPDSPRMLIELKGWVYDNEIYPENIDTSKFPIDRYSVNLLLGKILYENLDMSREDEFQKKMEREYGAQPKSLKSPDALAKTKSLRRSKIRGQK